MTEWLKDWWPLGVLLIGQVLLFIRASDKLNLRVEQLRKDLDDHITEVAPLLSEFSGLHALIKSLLRRFEDADRQASVDRAEMMLAINSGVTRVETRVADLDKRVFDLVKNAKSN